MSMESRASVFHEVNERIAAITAEWVWEEKQGFLCECSTMKCTEVVWLTRSEYESIRATPSRRFTVPGHELADGDLVVEREHGFIVVETAARGTIRL